ncbi:DUF1636 family protein [Yoonia tamlensis]|nr:DUF1636 family protein [Yoonia tamlensis]
MTICDTCEGPGRAFAEDMRAVLSDWDVRLHTCFSVCSKPIGLSIQADDKATYLFSGLGRADVDDLVAFTALYDAAPDGWITDVRPAGRVRFCLTGRVPA